jgi:TolB-like protein
MTINLFAELKRRKVFRVAVVYAATAFVVLQAADIMLPRLAVPEWAMTLVVVFAVLGFPIALVLAWALEVTPDGVKVTRPRDAVPTDDPPPSLLGKRTVFAAALLMVLGIGIGAGWFLRPVSGPDVAPAVERVAELAADVPAVVDKSIAVLPFADFSPGGDQEWFADGLAEEILNALTRTPDLLVAARTSSFRYKGSALDIPQIASELGVAHVLEGSIRSTPQRIRVTAQLIRAADGFHLWSETYDRDLADMIEIQEDLARSIALAMQTSMDPQALADMASVGTRSVEAYQAYIRGLGAGTATFIGSSMESYELFERARALDPGFAAAHASAALFWLRQLDVTATDFGLSDLPPRQIEALFRERIRAAIDVASTPVERAGYEAGEARFELRWHRAIGQYQTYLAERPGDALAKSGLLMVASQASEAELLRQLLDAIWPEAQLRWEMANLHVNHAHRTGDTSWAADQALALLEWWPDDFTMLYQAHRALLWDGRVTAAGEVLGQLQRLARGDEPWVAIPAVRQACAEGRRDVAERMIANDDGDNIAQRWHQWMLLGDYAAATELLRQLERGGNLFALASFLVYPHFDPSPYPSLMRILEREQVRRPPPVALLFACPPREAGL